MPSIIELETPRLRMRQWRESDRVPFAAMNADPAVMEFFASPPSRAAGDASISAWQAQFAAQGWSNWAVELGESGEFIGFTGLSVPRRTFSFSPCVEVGWRLAREFWAHHTMARFTGRASDVLSGTVFAVTPDEIQNADKYEVAAVKRVAAVLQSGVRAWVYVDARDAPLGS